MSWYVMTGDQADTWVHQMLRDAVAIAFPEWEWQDGDLADLTTDYEPGYEMTPGEGFSLTVRVERPGGPSLYKDYGNTRGVEFFTRLMQQGSQRKSGEERDLCAEVVGEIVNGDVREPITCTRPAGHADHVGSKGGRE